MTFEAERVQKFHTDNVSLPTIDLGSASDYLRQISLAVRLTRSTTQIWALLFPEPPGGLGTRTRRLWELLQYTGF